MFKRVDHIEIVPTDVEATINFYVDVLQFTLKSRHEVPMPPMKEVIYLQLGDTVIEIISADKPSDKSNEAWQVGYRCIALEVDNMDEALSYLKDKNIEPTWGPADLGNSFRSEIQDPDGLQVELREWK
jgi:catechol 2,3-dioxygenase-like lactoylglutathione lyase family enzyme|tara:strand:- start:241 stop:624 length:384 start_codon:yes stop_codon:yes gene_type:complete